MFPSRTVYGLLHGVIGKNTENDGCFVQYVQIFYALCNSLTNKIEMFGLALYNTSYGYNGIYHLLLHFFAAVNQFEATWHVPPHNIIGVGSIFKQCIVSPLEQGFCNSIIPF